MPNTDINGVMEVVRKTENVIFRANTCPGGGKVDKKAKGEEVPLKTALKQLVARIKKKEVNPQESSAPLIPVHIPSMRSCSMASRRTPP